MSQAAAGRAYAREFAIAMAAYVLAVIVTVWLTPNIEPTFRAPFVLIPLIPSTFALRAYLRFLDAWTSWGDASSWRRSRSGSERQGCSPSRRASSRMRASRS